MPAGLDEFDLIRTCFEPLQATDPEARGIILGIGDDAAILAPPAGQQLALSVDTIVSGVHFPEGSRPEDIGWRALAVNVSDLAAMAAQPLWFTLSLCVPRVDRTWLDNFAAGMSACADHCGIALVGGDTVQGPLCISVQVAGAVPAGCAITRSGARPGDAVLVSGTLGDAAGGLEISHTRARPELSPGHAQYLSDRFNRPQPRLALVGLLRRDASAAIDVSDGLIADLGHLLEASGYGATVQVPSVPVSPALESIFGSAEARRMALGGGDDYELCFTVLEEDVEKVVDQGADSGIPITRIGTIEAEQGLRCIDDSGALLEIDHTGYRHFQKA